MAELDLLKEKISYLRLWLGLLAITTIGSAVWLAANLGKAHTLLIISDLVAIVVLTILVFMLHRRIGDKIECLREL
jgi:vacuolar-type H+-ATPase subunit I/STV1